MAEKILITGANGHLGTSIINFLIKKKTSMQIVALVRDAKNTRDLELKDIEVREGDYFNYDSLLSAFKDINKVVLISSSDVKDRVTQHSNVIKAAIESNVKHIYYTSLMLNEDAKAPRTILEEGHKETEDFLKSSGVTYTVFRNGMYFDMILRIIGEDATKRQEIRVPVNESRAAFTSRDDIAEGIAEIVMSKGHDNSIYNMASNKTYSFQDIAKNLSEIENRQVSYLNITEDQFKTELKNEQRPEKNILEAIALSEMIRDDKVSNTDFFLKSLLRRELTTLRNFLTQSLVHR